jgi:hypothetical protein
MPTKIAKSLLLSFGLASTLFSCSQKEQIQPAATVLSDTALSSSVKVANGRLVFANMTAFEQTYNDLTKLKGNEPFATWEKQFQFSSLRAASNVEIAHLEELDSQGKHAPAYELMNKFGFPVAYSSIINSNGEYQVGDDIYWFHDGFKYLAKSEDELAAIKSNPSTAKVKFSAGSKSISVKKVSNVGDRTYGYGQFSDDKYIYPFSLTNDSRNRRRIIYCAYVYKEAQGERQPGFFFYKSEIYIRIKYEYFSDGTGNWYQAKGQNFTYNANFSYDATCSAPCVGIPFTTKTGRINEQVSFDTGLWDLRLATENFTEATNCAYNGSNVDNIRWDFEVYGTISSYPAAYFPGTQYTQTGTLW